MHRIPKNPSQFSSPYSVSGAEEAHSNSGNRCRSRSPSSLDSSPLAKRKRGNTEEAPKSNLGSFDKARFDEVDARMKEKYEQSGITTGTNSLTINDSLNCFAEAFEATNPSYEEDWRLNDDFFPLAIVFDSGSQERLEERGENQSDSAEGSSTDLPTPYTDDGLADEDGEMDLGREPEANHAMPSSEVWERKASRMVINHNAFQNLIKTMSPDLTMAAWELRKAYIETYGEKSCPVSPIFRRDLKKMRNEWEKANPGQPKPWRERTEVDREALQKFITVESPDFKRGGLALQKKYIKIHGEASCPGLSLFESDLKKMKDEWEKANPGQPKPWQERTKVTRKALQSFITVESPDLKMSGSALRDVYIEKRGEKSCPSLSFFESNLYALRKKPVEENPSLESARS